MSYLSIRELNSSLKFLLNPLLSSRLIYLSNDSSNFLLVFLFPCYLLLIEINLAESHTESPTELHIESLTELSTEIFTKFHIVSPIGEYEKKDNAFNDLYIELFTELPSSMLYQIC